VSKNIHDIKRVAREGIIHVLLNEEVEHERRIIMIGDWTFANIQKDVESILNDEASAIFYDAGLLAGKETSKLLLNEWKERGKDFIKRWVRFYEETGTGWFKVKKFDINFEKEEAIMQITNSFIVTGYGKSKEPICHFLNGYFAGTLESILGKKITSKETMCEAKGDPYCEFKLETY